MINLTNNDANYYNKLSDDGVFTNATTLTADMLETIGVKKVDYQWLYFLQHEEDNLVGHFCVRDIEHYGSEVTRCSGYIAIRINKKEVAVDQINVLYSESGNKSTITYLERIEGEPDAIYTSLILDKLRGKNEHSI